MIIKIPKNVQDLFDYYEGQVVYLNGDLHDIRLIKRFKQNKDGSFMASIRMPQNGDVLDFSTARALYVRKFQAWNS